MSLKETFYYDPTSPSGLRWATERWRGPKKNPYVFIHAGDVAGCYDESVGYWRVFYEGKRVLAHRLVFMLHFDLDEADDVDHKDGDRLNNLVGNLRSVPGVLNSRNRKKSSLNTSGSTGVSFMTSLDYPHLSYWKAAWVGSDGKTKSKCFPIHKLGNNEAFEQAKTWRAKMIEERNEEGAGYTARHGT